MVAWGNNDHGQTSVSFMAMQVATIAAGYYHNLALRADGRVVAWGLDNYVPPEATNIQAIAAGWRHSLALRADGTVLAWGDNTFGQASVPPSATNVVALRAGFYHSLALRADGTVVAWGKPVFGVTTIPGALTNVTSTEAGEDFNLVQSGGRPRFGRQLESVSSHTGGQAVLTATVEAAYPATFQWFHNGVAIAGATNSSLALANLTAAEAGNYVLVVSNSAGTATSQPISLVVQPDTVTQTSVGAWGENIRGQCSIPPGITTPRAIAAGAFHSLALQADGTVIAWGKNMDGQTNLPPTATNVTAIAGGGDHSLALRADGSVVAWGRDWDGQTNVPSPATNVIAIAAGLAHSVALRADGQVIAWGNSEYGQADVPFNLSRVTAIAAGYYHTLALRTDNTVVAWGHHRPVPAAASNVVAIAAGWQHSLALRADGTVVAWGDDSYGQARVPAEATNVVAVAAGYYHSLALRANGTVIAWGKGFFYGVTNVPSGLDHVSSIATGEDHSMVLRELGPPRIESPPAPATVHVGDTAVFHARMAGSQTLVCQWAHDDVPLPEATNRFLALTNVQTGDSGVYVLTVTNLIGQATASAILTVLPEPYVKNDPQFTNVLFETDLCLSANVVGEQPLTIQWQRDGINLIDDHRISGSSSPVLCFGPALFSDSGEYRVIVNNAYGSFTGVVARVSVSQILAWGDDRTAQLQVPPGKSNVVAVVAGEDHSLALRRDGTAFGWGDNSHGQLNIPAHATNLVRLAAGQTHSLALTTNGFVIAWGDNSAGQTEVPAAATDVVDIAAGDTHSVALRSDGTVIAWGSGIATNVPPSATNLISVAAAGSSSSAMRANGTLVTWGTGPFPPAWTNIVASTVGATHGLALRANGQALAWGNNSFGQTNVPPSATNLLAISAGAHHNLALRVDGEVLAWGDDLFEIANVPNSELGFVGVAAGAGHCLGLVGLGPPWVSRQPQSGLVRAGESAVFYAEVSGGFPIGYQWYHNEVPVAGANLPYLIVNDAQVGDGGMFRLMASNVLGQIASRTATLTVIPEPMIASPATVRTVLTGGSTCFQITVLGALPYSVQWQLNGTNLVDDARITGAQSPSLCIDQVRYEDMGGLSVVVSNAYGSTAGLVGHLSVTDVLAWGNNSSGQTNVPPGATNVVSIAAGSSHCLALRDDGTVVAWGSTNLGLGVIPEEATNIVAIAAGGSHSLALRDDGAVIAWGSSSSGRNTVPSTATNIIGIANGGNHCLALRDDGMVIAWGDNFVGKTNVPPHATNVIAIAAGANHSLALREDGSVVGWGWNISGSTNVPDAATNVVAIAVGDSFNLAVRGDGTVIAWGSTAFGKTTVPETATNTVAVAAGSNHGLSLTGDGGVLAWGNNSFGQTNVPATAANVVAVRASANHSLALLGTDRDRIAHRHWERSATLGQPLRLTAPALGNAPVTYQWQFNGTNLPGATSAYLRLPFLHWTNAGVYRVIMTDAFGTIVGPAINLSVLPPVLTLDTSPGGLEMDANSFRMRLLGASGVGMVVLYSSTNLLTWEPILTNSLPDSLIEFTVPAPPNQTHRFYRAAEVYHPDSQ